MSKSAKSTKQKPKSKKAPAKSKPKPTKAKKAPAVGAKPQKPAAKKKAAEKKESPTPKVTTTKAKPRRLGQVPRAMVSARHAGSMRERAGRGFSIGELGSAGVTLDAARRGEVPLDVRRRSVLEANVEALKVWLKGSPGSGTA